MEEFTINKGDKIICQEGIEYEFVEETMFLGIEYYSQIIKSILENVYAYWAIAFFFAFMMVSTVRMFSLKGLNKDMRQNKLQLVLLIVFIILLLVDNKLAAPVIILLYIILSLAQSLSRKA